MATKRRPKKGGEKKAKAKPATAAQVAKAARLRALRQPRTGKEVAEAIFLAHLGQLSRHAERNGVGGLRKMYSEARGELLDRLRRLGPGDQSVNAQTLRAMLKQVDVVLGKMGKNFKKHLEGVGSQAAKLGAQHGADEFRILAEVFTGTFPAVNVDAPAVFRGMVKGVDRSLLRRHQLQSQTWSLNTVAQIERQMSVSAMTGKPLEKVIDDVMGSKGFEGERWQAERIVRTELHYAHGAAKQQSLEAVEEELGEPMWKRLLETFDNRTGDDSFLLHGQTVPAGKPFKWKTKRRGSVVVIEFMFPPNRPNDRAVAIPWDPSWKAEKGERPLTLAELRSAPTTRWRKHVGVWIPSGHTAYPYGKPKAPKEA